MTRLRRRSRLLAIALALWSFGSAASAQSPSPTAAPTASPKSEAVHIDSCNLGFFDALDGDYSVLVSARFHTVAAQPATAVRFRFLMVDHFGKVQDVQSGTVTGSFAPNAEIEPRYGALNGVLIIASAQFPSSPGWHLYNALGKDLDHVVCSIDAVRFADGTIE